MPAPKRGTQAASDSPAATTTRRKPGPKPGSRRGTGASGRVYKLYALSEDGNELTYLADSPPANTGPAAVLAAVKSGTVEANIQVVPLPESSLSPTVVEAQEVHEVHYAIKAPAKRATRRKAATTDEKPAAKRSTTKRSTAKNGRRKTTAKKDEAPVAPPPPAPPAPDGDNPFAGQ